MSSLQDNVVTEQLMDDFKVLKLKKNSLWWISTDFWLNIASILAMYTQKCRHRDLFAKEEFSNC